METGRAQGRLWTEAGLVAFVVVAVFLARFEIPYVKTALEGIELRLVDVRFWVRGVWPKKDRQAVAEKLAIVAMDDTATRKYGHPVPRARHAQLVKRLHDAGAKAVVFDVVFADRDLYRPQDDEEFAAACRAAGNVFLPFDDNSARETDPALLEKMRARLRYPLDVRDTADTKRLQPPVEPLFSAMRGCGHVTTKADIDGRFRKAILLQECGALYPHVALDAFLRGYLGEDPTTCRFENNYVVIGQHRFGPLRRFENFRTVRDAATGKVVPRRTGAGWWIPLNFMGGHRTMQELTVPYTQILEDDLAQVRQCVGGRIVIVGETATGTPDLRAAPFDALESEPFLGVETNATFIANLIRGNFLQPVDELWSWLSILLSAVLTGLAAATLRPRSALLATLGVAGINIAIAVAFFATNRVTELTAPLLATFVCFPLLTSYRLVFTEREYAQRMQEAQMLLGQFVNDRLARRLSENPEARLAMQIGTKREVTVLFSDIRSFTAWSERQTPEEVKARLDEYFPVMCEIADDDYNGYIDKFIGDELMVVWNGMDDHDDHAERAVRAALSMQRALAMLNDGWQRQKQEPFRIGIGIATGSAVFGTFGSRRHKFQATVLGDTVNLASRLQTATKETGSKIIISEATYEATKDLFEFEPLGTMAIRGKTEAQNYYSVIGTKAASKSD